MNTRAKPATRRVRSTATSETIELFMTTSAETIGLQQSLATAHKIMRENDIRHLPVLDAGKVVGILSLRDLHLIETLEGVDERTVTVDEAMTPEPYCVQRTAPLESVARTMASHKYGSAIVLEDGHVVGIFTTTDALTALAWALERSRPV